MPTTNYVQDVFSKGELAPSMYSRVTTEVYYKSLKVAKNILPIPQGGARKRFALKRQVTAAQTDYTAIYPFVFDYLNECIYQMILYSGNIDIYLEGRLIATATGTGIDAADIGLVDHTILDTEARFTTGYIAPGKLVRSASSANNITAVDTANNFITLNSAVTDDTILPVRFTNSGGALPTTVPQIKAGRTYFIHALSTTTAAIYSSPTDAASDTNRYDLTASGSGTNNMIPQNTWTFSSITFRNVPVYDFDGGYDAITFTPSVTTGAGTLTASAAIFTAAHVGGLYFGKGGVARITEYTSSTAVNITVINDFSATTAIQGINSVLTEPAWSATRGYPSVCSSYQTRSAFANTELLPNGVWLSAINDYDDFDDSSLDDDQAISWYPSSDIGNYIRFLSPDKSLLVHTDTGVYSTPIRSDNAITPRTFSLTRQDDTPSALIQPVYIDNQIFIAAGVDIISLITESGQYDYNSLLVSAVSEHLITDPNSMASFRDQGTRGGRYVFVCNQDTGRLAMFQTLISENVSGWTWAQSEQYYGDAYFRYVISSVQGRCWFIMEREVASPQTHIAITAFDANNKTFTCTASNFSTSEATAFIFEDTGTLPTTSPQVVKGKYYYAVGVDANTFLVYKSIADAESDIADKSTSLAIDISSAGTSAFIIQYTLSTILTIEELKNDVYTDSAIIATANVGATSTTLSGLDVLNGQTVSIKANGVAYDSNPVIAGATTVTSLGQQVTGITDVEVGIPIQYQATPLPLSIPISQGIQTSNLVDPKHVRFAHMMFTDTIGGKVNNQNIAIKNLITNPFNPPDSQTGLMQISTLNGWDDFMNSTITITQSDPYSFILIGIFYSVEV